MTFKGIALSDLQIVACKKWMRPPDSSILPVFHVVPFSQVVPAGAIQTFELATPDEFDFVCKVISSTCVTPGTLVQVQWPDGRYLSNPGVDVFSFMGTGKRGRLIDPFKRMSPNQKIRLNIDNSAVGTASSIELFFEGALQVPFEATK